MITAKQRSLCAQIEPLLRKYDLGGNGSILSYLPLIDLRSILAYLKNTPRITRVGFQMTEKEAAHVIGGTLRSGGNIRLAILLDCLDNRYHKIARSLKDTGVTINHGALDDISEADVLRYSALLHAENVTFERFGHHEDYKNGKVSELYRYVGENPSQASRIMEVAKQRYSLDVSLIETVLGTDVPALESGVL